MNTVLSLVDFAALSPLFVVLATALILLLLECFSKTAAKKYSLFLTALGIVLAIYAAWAAPISHNPLLTPWIRFDDLARLFTLLFLSIGLGAALLSDSFFDRFEASRGEYYFLLLSSLFGLILVGSAADFLTFFLGLETLSVSLYVLCGYMKKWQISQESSIKYFLIGSLAAAFLLYGIALIYGAVGTTRFDALLNGYKALTVLSDQRLFLAGIAFVTFGLAFKAAIVPFHTWAPDVYEGAPTPVTAFMAVGTKAGAFAAFTVIFLYSLPQFNVLWNECIALLAFPTLIYANFVAMKQTQLRRFFAYSGISHAGFLLIPLAVGTSEAIPALVFYLAVYAFATLGAFAGLSFLETRQEGVMLSDLKGLFKRSPWIAGLISICLLTLGGIPPTIGFLAKFYLFKIAFQAGYYSLVIVALFTTILSAYYYLRIVGIMLSESSTKEEIHPSSWPAGIVGFVSVIALIFFSFFPDNLYRILF